MTHENQHFLTMVVFFIFAYLSNKQYRKYAKKHADFNQRLKDINLNTEGKIILLREKLILERKTFFENIAYSVAGTLLYYTMYKTRTIYPDTPSGIMSQERSHIFLLILGGIGILGILSFSTFRLISTYRKYSKLKVI